MKKIEYQILSLNELIDKDYIEIAVGKQRKRKFKETSIYFMPNVFSLLDGIIWENYREYSPTTTNAITKSDWLRIIEGFEESITFIEKSQSVGDIKEALFMRPYAELSDNENFDAFKKEILALVTDLKNWILSNLDNEKYISICV